MFEAAVARLAPAGALRAVAGGWALDLAFDVEPRAHGDRDIAIFRDDQRVFRLAFVHEACAQVINGEMEPWHVDAWIAPPIHELHIRAPGDGAPMLKLLLNERDGSSRV